MNISRFGLPQEAVCYFEVTVGRDRATITEVLNRTEIKAVIPRPVWDVIANTVKGEFNTRLKQYNERTGRWTPTTRLDRTFGKELTLLAWALEDAPADKIDSIVRNWRGFAPEERWWLYTTTNATSDKPTFGKDRGWRKAIRIALSENE